MTWDSSSGQVPLPSLATATGDVLGGRYQLLVPIASGGMGSIWAARQVGKHQLRGLVALKIAHPQYAHEERFEKMFLDEARLASAVRHPNVCTVYDLGEDRGVLYLVMEWIGGGSLHELLGRSRDKRLDFRIAAKIMAGACAGMHAAHELKDDKGNLVDLIHRDVSPQNILITAEGVVKLTDFGVARAKDQLHQTTTTGEVKGKLSYMAPEQFGGRAYDRRVDVFSLGCVLYRALVGKRSFEGTSAEIMFALLNLRFASPRSLVPEIPVELESIVLRAMARAEDRYPTAEAMQRDLEAWLATQPPCTDADVAEVLSNALGTVIVGRRSSIEMVTQQIDTNTYKVVVDASTTPAPDDPTKAVAMAAPGGGSTEVLLDSPGTGSHTSKGVTVTLETRRSASRKRMLIGTVVASVTLSGALLWAALRSNGDTKLAEPLTTTEGSAVASVSAVSGPPVETPTSVSETPTTVSDPPAPGVPIAVRSNVSDAQLSIDDGPPQSLPFRGTLPAGERNYVLRVWAPRHQMESRTIPSEPADLFIALRPLRGAGPAAAPWASTAKPSTTPSASPSDRSPRPTVSSDFGAPLSTSPPRRRKEIDKDDPFEK